MTDLQKSGVRRGSVTLQEGKGFRSRDFDQRSSAFICGQFYLLRSPSVGAEVLVLGQGNIASRLSILPEVLHLRQCRILAGKETEKSLRRFEFQTFQSETGVPKRNRSCWRLRFRSGQFDDAFLGLSAADRLLIMEVRPNIPIAIAWFSTPCAL